jgi:hypothetical protein
MTTTMTKLYTVSNKPALPRSPLNDLQPVPPPNRPRTHDHYWACIAASCDFWCYDATKIARHDKKTGHTIIQVEIPIEGPSPYREYRPGINQAIEQYMGHFIPHYDPLDEVIRAVFGNIERQADNSTFTVHNGRVIRKFDSLTKAVVS